MRIMMIKIHLANLYRVHIYVYIHNTDILLLNYNYFEKL